MTPHRPRVLVVDDNPDNCDYARVVLEERYEVQVAGSGSGALARAASAVPDLMLLDLSLPHRDGFAILAELRGQPSMSRVIVVACTAHALSGDRDRTVGAGFDAYLAKPYRPRELLDLVAAFIGPGVPHTDRGGWDLLEPPAEGP